MHMSGDQSPSGSENSGSRTPTVCSRFIELGRDWLSGWGDDDDRHAGGQPRPSGGAEIPVDEGSARVDDIALLDEGSKASAAQADGVDTQMNEDREPARRGDNCRVRFELGDHSVDGGSERSRT